MLLLSVLYLYILVSSAPVGADLDNSGPEAVNYRRAACPDYTQYSAQRHPPYSTGSQKLPYQRPAEECRLFKSSAVEAKIKEITSKMTDPDAARLFENCFPNTLDTTVRWHVNSNDPTKAQTFIVTGDINAQWLRDSTNQLQQYQSLAKSDPALQNLLVGAINTQADFILTAPYCNAFQPPRDSGLPPTDNGQGDTVHPAYDPQSVFECKYEIDSLASFLALGNQYHKATGDDSYITTKYLKAVQTVLDTVDDQSVGTFSADGDPNDMTFTFQRETTMGTETLNLKGIGNPIAADTSLIRSAFRPSDDACILQFFIPGNAFLSVELDRTATIVAHKSPALAKKLAARSSAIREGVYKHGIIQHPVFGKVFAYEVDGYGSQIIMDDANLPSLLALPLLGFVARDDPVYINTRKMVLGRQGNPYYLVGSEFQGIGGPHIGIVNAWPLSKLVAAMTSDDDEEILEELGDVVKISAHLGLIHESVNVDRVGDYTSEYISF
jgi:meiotically up-regulated gene 157 (Mug157) protein